MTNYYIYFNRYLKTFGLNCLKSFENIISKLGLVAPGNYVKSICMDPFIISFGFIQIDFT